MQMLDPYYGVGVRMFADVLLLNAFQLSGHGNPALRREQHRIDKTGNTR